MTTKEYYNQSKEFKTFIDKEVESRRRLYPDKEITVDEVLSYKLSENVAKYYSEERRP